MKKSDLHREWARVIDMCEGTGVDPRECLRIDGEPCRLENPLFNDDPECYTFMVAILEGRPLFVGDEVYWKNTGEKFDWTQGELCHASYYQYLTRTPPKRTITLNGEKLPAPDDGNFYLYVAGFNHIQYGFKNGEDLMKVESAINKLLRGE
jgi:hypothetical protein